MWSGLDDGERVWLTVAACNRHGCGPASDRAAAAARQTADPSVAAAWGVACGEACQEVLVEARNLPPFTAVQVTCHRDDTGVYGHYEVTTDVDGYDVSSGCRTDVHEGLEVWVDVGGVPSNRIVWR